MAEEIEQDSAQKNKKQKQIEQDFFTNLPAEMIINILSRLPVQTIIRSKCVRKSWLHLIESDEFANSHIVKSVPMLAVMKIYRDSRSCKAYEFEDGLDIEDHELHYNPLFQFDIPDPVSIKGSANGLLLLYKHQSDTDDQLYVCNPVTRDYIELDVPEGFGSSYSEAVVFGFGASKVTGQLKVVQILNDSINARYGCQIQTLGTESWRSIELGSVFEYDVLMFGAFLNGHLHWIVSDSNGITWISCFDLEAECFSSFAVPPLGNSNYPGGLSALGDHLCLCDNSDDDVVVIWLMKEHGVDNSWTKQYVFSRNPEFDGDLFEHIYAIKMFGDGCILLSLDDCFLRYYSSKTKTMEDINIFASPRMNSILFTPSFLSVTSSE